MQHATRKTPKHAGLGSGVFGSLESGLGCEVLWCSGFSGGSRTFWDFFRLIGTWLQGVSSFKRLEPWMSVPSVSDSKAVSRRHEVVHQLSWQTVQASSFKM